jgi:hypothetical protein
MYGRCFKKNRHSDYLKIIHILVFSVFIAFGCSDSSSGGGGSAYHLMLGVWSGQDISFTVSQGSYLINDLSVTYRGTLCNDNYEVNETIQETIPVTDNTFSYDCYGSDCLTIVGEFVGPSEVEVEISWSRYDSQCDATEEGTNTFTAAEINSPQGLNTYYRDADRDLYGDPDVSVEDDSRPSGYVADNTDCDDMNPSIHPLAIDFCGDGIDQDCNGRDLDCREFYPTD